MDYRDEDVDDLVDGWDKLSARARIQAQANRRKSRLEARAQAEQVEEYIPRPVTPFGVMEAAFLKAKKR